MNKIAQRARMPLKWGSKHLLLDGVDSPSWKAPVSQPLAQSLVAHTAQEASLDTCFYSHRLQHPVWRPIKRWQRVGGNQAAWALMAVFIQGGFFF